MKKLTNRYLFQSITVCLFSVLVSCQTYTYDRCIYTPEIKSHIVSFYPSGNYDSTYVYISGRIEEDSQHQPLDNIVLSFKNQNNHTTTTCTSDQEGKFEIYLLPDSYFLEVNTLGYAVLDSTIRVNEKTANRLTIALGQASTRSFVSIKSRKKLSEEELKKLEQEMMLMEH